MTTCPGFQTFVRSRSDIVIKQMDKYFSGGPVRQWLILDPLLRGNVENERDLGLERLRQTIMDIASKWRYPDIFIYLHRKHQMGSDNNIPTRASRSVS